MWETMNRLIRANLPVGERLSFMDTPAWMQVVERRLEQAAEESSY